LKLEVGEFGRKIKVRKVGRMMYGFAIWILEQED